MSNRHMCCICHAMPAMIHFIDGDRSNYAQGNLAALCHRHYRRANLPESDPERLDPDEIRRAKSSWQRECLASLLGLRGKG